MPEENDIPLRPEGRAKNAAVSPQDEERVRIYFLPNLLTAGNLACGFFALTWIFKYQTQYRADAVRNLVAWYDAFSVRPPQKLYLAPKDRVRVW